MKNNWMYVIVWEIKRTGKVKELSTLDKVDRVGRE